MIKKLLLIAALCAVTVFADANNVRPVGVNVIANGEDSLQTILNQIYSCSGCISAASNQQTAALWSITGTPPGVVTVPMMQAKYASNGDPVGIYTGNTLVPIFTAGAVFGNFANVQFLTANSIEISGGANINSGTFTGISQNSFGFYMDSNGTDLFTEDSRNGGTARALAYVKASNDRWAIAFEDGNDFDYNDRVISVESIEAVPEPGAIVLFGTVLVLGATRLRRRKA